MNTRTKFYAVRKTAKATLIVKENDHGYLYNIYQYI